MRYRHSLAQGLFRRYRQLRVDSDRNVWHDLPEQAFANPFAAQNGVILVTLRERNEPARLREDPGPLSGGKLDWLLIGKVGEVVGFVDVAANFGRLFGSVLLGVLGLFYFEFSQLFDS